MMKLVNPKTAPSGGPCACCEKGATMWLRQTAECGLVVAALSCAEHESTVRARLSAVSVADVAAQTRAKPAALRRRAAKLAGVSHSHGRASANLRGASSATHSLALTSAYYQREASAILALADEIEARAGRVIG